MKNSIRSEGIMTLTKGYGGPFTTTDVEFYADPTGTRGFYVSGRLETQSGDFRSVLVRIPNDLTPGKHIIPQSWPNAINVTYYHMETSRDAKSGTLNLLSNESGAYHLIGEFDFIAEVDGAEHSFEGNFDIRLKQAGVRAEISDNPIPYVSYHITQDNNSDPKRNATRTRTRSGDRHFTIYIDKDIAVGTHDIAMGKKVSIHYIAVQPEGGQYNYYPDIGSFVITRRDSNILDATFNCEAEGMPGEGRVTFSNGKVEILDFGK